MNDAHHASRAGVPGFTTPQDPEPRPLSSRAPYMVLGLSVIGIAFAAPLVRLSNAPPLVIAAWRLGLSLVIIVAVIVARNEWHSWRLLTRREWLLSVLGGVFLALHFWSWNASLELTTVAASVTLVNLQPVLVAIISARWLGERASRRQWVGILIAVVGALVVGLADVPGGLAGIATMLVSGADGTVSGGSSDSARALLGDGLALVGAITAALYYLIGRRVRAVLPLWPYVGLVYSAAFVTCIVLVISTGDPLWPQPPREIAIFAGLALGPMLLGHTGMNWALGYLPAYVVNLTTLGEPLGATALAALLPGIAEIPGWQTVAGGALILAGILLAVRRR